MIEGDVQELKNLFDFATYTDCMMIYFHVKGDVFLLYKGGHYVYFKTAIITSKNIAVPNLSCQNIYRFISAEMRRADRENREIYTIRIEEDHIVSSALMDISYQYKIPLQADTFFSEIAVRLLGMLKNTQNVTGTIRIQKKVFTQFAKKSTPRKQSFIQLHVENGELVIERIQLSELKKRIVFNEGFSVTKNDSVDLFPLNDSMLQMLKIQRSIPQDAYMYLSKNDEFVQLEYNGIPGMFRFFLPLQNKTKQVNAL